MNLEDTARSSQPNAFDTQPCDVLVARAKVLIAAETATADALRDVLAPGGYAIATAAADGVLGLAEDFDPDLVLLDYDFALARGEELERRLAARPSVARPALLLLVPEDDPVDTAELIAAGATDVLFAPLRAAEVVARVRWHLLIRAQREQVAGQDRAKNRLLCMAAHDLRNPLVSIRALTNLVRAGTAGKVNAAQRDLLDTIYDASQSMLELVNELLEASVTSAGQVTIAPKPCSLAWLVESCVRIANAAAGEKASHLVLEAGPLPPEISIDEPKIRQVLSNLLGNAIKFSPPGSTITVLTESTPDYCVVVVRDQGPGIRTHERAGLFKDFARAAAKPTAGETSTGLGLATCHRIMQAHAGTIEIADAPDGGAEFRIALPIVP